MEKIAFYTEKEARIYANELCESENAYISGTVSVDCLSFNTPREIDSWSGEICAFEVVSLDTYETIAYIAYWE